MTQQTITIKVEMSSEKRRCKAFKLAAAAQGVESVEMKGEDEVIVIKGDGVDAVCLTNSLRKKFGFAKLLSLQPPIPPDNNDDGGGGGGGDNNNGEENNDGEASASAPAPPAAAAPGVGYICNYCGHHHQFPPPSPYWWPCVLYEAEPCPTTSRSLM